MTEINKRTKSSILVATPLFIPKQKPLSRDFENKIRKNSGASKVKNITNQPLRQKPVVINSRFPTPEEMAKTYGIGKRRLVHLSRFLDMGGGFKDTKFQKENKIVAEGLKKLNSRELNLLGRFVKADVDFKYYLTLMLIESVQKDKKKRSVKK